MGRRVDPGSWEGGRCRGFTRMRKPPQEGVGGSKPVICAWPLLTLAASDWAQIMLWSARRLELEVARGLHRCQALRTWFASPR